MKMMIFFLVLSSIMLQPCCFRQPGIAPLTEDSVILAFGDSLTAGIGASGETSYPAVLERLTGCRVINAGIPGELSEEGVKRLPSLLDREGPDLVVLCHGGNDILNRIDEARTIMNLRSMVEEIRGRGIDTIMIGVPKPALRLKTASFYVKIAQEYDIPCEAEIIAKTLSSPALKSDSVHPNAAGYRKIAESIVSLIPRER